MSLRTLVEGMMIRARFANLAGKTYNGCRDLYRALGYKRDLLPIDYRNRFDRNEVAWRIVTAAPAACWRGGAEIIEDEDPDFVTDFEQAVIDLDKRVGIWPNLLQVDVLSRIGRYGVLFLGLPGELSQPAEKLTNPKDLAFIRPLAEEDALVQRYEIDRNNPRYGLPVMYTLNRTSISNGGTINNATLALPVHWSRIIHITTDPLDDQVFGQPVLRKVWNRLDDLEKVAGSGPEAFWRRADGGRQFDLDPEMNVTDAELEALRTEVQKYEHELKRTLTTRGVTTTNLGSDVADFSGPVQSLISLISAGTGIPQRVLMGSEQGKLAAKQDRSAWENQITDRQEDVCTPRFVTPLIDRLIELGALPEPLDGPTAYEVEFSSIRTMDDEQRSTIAGQWAALNKSGQPPTVLRDEIREVLGLPPFTEVATEEDLLAEMQLTDDQQEPIIAARKGGADRYKHIHAAADRFRAGAKASRLRGLREGKIGVLPGSARNRRQKPRRARAVAARQRRY